MTWFIPLLFTPAYNYVCVISQVFLFCFFWRGGGAYVSNKFEGEKRVFHVIIIACCIMNLAPFWNIFLMPFNLCVDSRLIIMQFLMFSFCFFSGYKLDGWPRSPTKTST